MTSRRIAVAYDCLFPYTTGGGERQYRAFAEAMVDEGRAVDYLTAVQWDEKPEGLPFSVTPVSRRLTLYSPDGTRRIPAALEYAWGLFRTLRRRRGAYDAIVVSALPVFNVLAARLALAGSGTRIVVDWLEVWRRPQWVEYSGKATGTVAWGLQRLAIAASPLATCHSGLSARRLRSEGLRSEPLVSAGLIGSDAAPAVVHPAARPPFVLYAGRHIPDKQVESLPGAVRVAREQLPDLRLVILGDGPSSGAVRRAVADAGGEEWTEMPGFVEQEVLDTLMGDAACLVNPSRREGYGLVVVESSRYGTPVVLVEHEGNASTELVEEGTNGHIAPSASSEHLGSAIVDAVRGGDSLRNSTSAWYQQAVTTRTIRRTVEAILATIDAPVGQHPRKEQKP